MSEVVEFILNVVCEILDVFTSAGRDSTSEDTTINRIIWLVVILFIGGMVWWELH
jgi:hypothetical protein